jgi:hypothetical protein
MSVFFIFLTIDHIGQCGGKEKTSTSVRISTSYSDDESCDQHNEIFYTFMYHGCNNETTSYNVFYIIRDFYSICREKYQIKITERTIQGVPEITTQKFFRISLLFHLTLSTIFF